MKKTILFFIIFHLLIIFIVNLNGTINSYKVFYNGEDYKPSKIDLVLKKVVFTPFISNYSSYAGTDASYGFYAPNVASQFTMSLSVIDSTGLVIANVKRPNLKQSESIMRFDLCLSMMQQKLGWANSNEILNNFFKVMIHQIAMDVKKDFPLAKTVSVSIYLYDYPTIGEYLNSNKESYILVDHYEF